MELLHQLLNFILHLDQYLFAFVSANGQWAYILLFTIIFCETGLVITPFLPGDSLLFAAGSIAANTTENFNIHALFILLVTASILGNGLNYAIGRFLGPKVFNSNNSILLNKRYLQEAHAFYERHGGKTIIFARFIPIIRTFAPFVAGIGAMSYKRFFAFNTASAFLWIGSLLYVSFHFGNMPWVKEHFSSVIMAIIIVSLIPAIIEFIRHKLGSSTH